MSPLGGKLPLEEYHGEKEHSKLKAQEANRSKETTSEESCEILHRYNTKDNSSDFAAFQHYKNPSFKEEISNKIMVPSPAPVVEMGGEDEFVKVSHRASVQVKPVPTINITNNKSEQQNLVRKKLPRRSEDVVFLASRSSAKKLRRGSGHKKYIGDDDFDDVSSTSSHNDESPVKILVDIEKSPYEPGKCAENGESIFEEMKALLLADEDDGNSQIVQIFGRTNAGCLVKANVLIEKSGMLYSQTWNKGSIRGNPVGIIPNHLLLMVLVSNRFAKASELLLSGLCRDLEVYDSVNRGLDDWGWEEDYKLVRATKKNYKFKANKRDCFKCAVFVARAHSCFLAFGKRKLKSRMINKLKTCFDMMEAQLVALSPKGHNGHDTSNSASATSTSTGAFLANVKKRKKAIPDHVLSTPSLMASSLCNTASTSAIKKRGRTIKSSKNHNVQQRSSSTHPPSLQQPECEKNNSMEDQKESSSSRLKHHNLQSNRVRMGSRAENAAASLISRHIPSSPLVPSLHGLMSRFEDQYKEMGQRYAEMGSLLKQMKTAIEDNRERSEQEIRKELLDEIQKNILESIPKR